MHSRRAGVPAQERGQTCICGITLAETAFFCIPRRLPIRLSYTASPRPAGFRMYARRQHASVYDVVRLMESVDNCELLLVDQDTVKGLNRAARQGPSND